MVLLSTISIPMMSQTERTLDIQIHEYDRAIAVLQHGLKEEWTTREEYLVAFDKTFGLGRETTLRQTIEFGIHDHHVWDEHMPIGVEVHRVISRLQSERNSLLTQKRSTHKDSQ
jgi:hypothetical protein